MPKHCTTVYNSKRQDFTTLGSYHDRVGPHFFLSCTGTRFTRANTQAMLYKFLPPVSYYSADQQWGDSIVQSTTKWQERQERRRLQASKQTILSIQKISFADVL